MTRPKWNPETSSYYTEEEKRAYRLDRMCTSKAPYKTQKQANQKGYRVYLCPHCDNYHRTTAKSSKWKRWPD